MRFDFEAQRQANRSLITAPAQRFPEPEPEPEPPEEAAEPASREAATEGMQPLVDAPPQALPEAAAPPKWAPEPEPPKALRHRKVIEFPRPAAQYFLPADELASPVVDTPRIVEASPVMQEELLPVVPAITLDESSEPEALSAELALPTQPAAIAQRIFAALTDAVVIAIGIAAFAFVALRTAPITAGGLGVPAHTRAALMALAATVAFFWLSYHTLLLVYGGATAGMRVAGLELRSFEGARLSRAALRRRAAAMVISALAAGLGFFWAAFDEYRLGWHDRMSRTYLVSR